jgi:hypothetical protein
MGLLSQDTFSALAAQIGQTFTSLVAQGKDGGEVLFAMQQPLQQLWEEEQQFGFKVDDATQALIDEAAKAGLVGEAHKSSTQQMIDGINMVDQDLKDLIGVLTGQMPAAFNTMANSAVKAFDQIPTSVNVDLTSSVNGNAYDRQPQDQGYSYGGLVRYMASGGPIGTDTVKAWLTPGEGVITKTGMTILSSINTGNVKDLVAPIAQGSIDAIFGALQRHIDVMPAISQGPLIPASPPGFSGPPTVTGGPAVTVVVNNTWNLSNLNSEDMKSTIEHEILPEIIAQVEDGRRGMGRRLARGLRANV